MTKKETLITALAHIFIPCCENSFLSFKFEHVGNWGRREKSHKHSMQKLDVSILQWAITGH